MTKIIHFTTVHPRTDTRIKLKELGSLAASLTADVELFVQDGLGDEFDEKSNVKIVDTGKRPAGRLARMTAGSWRMFRAVWKANPDIAHFHDPELMPAGMLLKLRGIKIIYDVHEDLPKQILSKDYIPKYFRYIVAKTISGVEWLATRIFDQIIVATPSIGEHFKPSKCTLVQNYPILGELLSEQQTPYDKRPSDFAYVGGITAIRSAYEMIEALSLVSNQSVGLQLAGAFSSSDLQEKTMGHDGWTQVTFHGWADRKTVAGFLGEVRAGLVLFYPVPNHMNSQPNKLFEYMAAGLPVIASDFPFWRKALSEVNSAIFVDPKNPQAIADAMRWVLDNPKEAQAMGQRGKDAVSNKFNWEPESVKLINLYNRLLGENQ